MTTTTTNNLNTISNFTGLGSGQYINITALVSASISSESNQLSLEQDKQSTINTNISSLAKVKSSIASLQDAFKGVINSLHSFTTSTLPNGLSLNPTASGNHNIGVSQLASSQINSFKQSFSSGALGFSGTLDLNTGSNVNGSFSKDKTTSIDIASTDTLQDIANKINAANPGFNAGIINNNGSQYLSLSSGNSGADGAFEVVAHDSGTTGLSSLNLVQGGTNFNSVSSAQDAIASVDGITLNSKTNTFTGVPGLTFTATHTFANQEVKVSQDTSAISAALKKFATQYNTTKSDLKNDGLKDRTLNNFEQTLRSTFSAISSSDYANSLNNVGISFDKTGLMNFDSSKITASSSSILLKQFTNNDTASALFSNTLVAGKIDSLNTMYTAQSKSIAERVDNLQENINKKQIFYQSQYAALDNNLSQINNNLANVTALMKQFTE